MIEHLEVRDTTLPGVHLVQRRPLTDERGWLERMFDSGELAAVIGARSIVQVNRTATRIAATVRGMHFQIQPSAEAKIVSCLRGEVFDVAIDVRRDSPTFLQWHAEVVSRENRRSLFIPEGFAHGFQSLVDDCELLYFHTAAYDPAAERGLHPLDPRLGIAWPLAIEHLSERDASFPPLGPEFSGIAV
ncbi:MAG: dTDP-4-dehydrorhamnose 3,5-epimerase family protein [Chloroflexota bacterium]